MGRRATWGGVPHGEACSGCSTGNAQGPCSLGVGEGCGCEPNRNMAPIILPVKVHSPHYNYDDNSLTHI